MFKRKAELVREIALLKKRIELKQRTSAKGEEVMVGVIKTLNNQTKEQKKIISQLIKERDLYRGKVRLQTEEDLAMISLRILIEILTQNHDNETLKSLRDRQRVLEEEWR